MSTTLQRPAKRRARVFINYRREDASGYAGSLHRWLKKRSHLGPDNVFMDVSTIKPGEDFVKAIEEVVRSCDAMVVLIGQEWLDCLRSKLEAQEDWVRYEISLALTLKKFVIPVCVDGASVPRPEDLPDSLEPLVRLQAHRLTNEDWEYYAGQLLEIIREKCEPTKDETTEGETTPLPFWWRRILLGLRRGWRLFPVRLLAGLLILSAALVPQLLLAYRPEPVSLEETGMFSPASVKLGREVLTIEAPSPDSEGLLLAHVPHRNEIVELGFERAQLHHNTVMLYGERNPPGNPSRVELLTVGTGEASGGEACRTTVRVRVADELRPPSALRFYQEGMPGGDVLRTLMLKADANLLVIADTAAPPAGDERSPGCAKLLKVAPDFSTPVFVDDPVSVVAHAASVVRFSFNPATVKEKLFDGAGGLFPPFAFGNNSPTRLRARAVEVVTHGGQGAGPAPVLVARSANSGEPLGVEGLLVGSDHLQVKVSGVGFVKVNGKDYADPLGRVKRHPLPSLLLALADLALLAWVVHLIFGQRRSPVLR